MSLSTLLETVSNQTAVKWSKSANTGYGSFGYGAGTEIQVRWADEAEKVTDAQGQEFISRARVLLPADAEVGDMLYLGTLASLTAPQQSDPKKVVKAFEIKRMDRRSQIRGASFIVFEAWLG